MQRVLNYGGLLLNTPRVLLVEDDPAQQRVLRRALLRANPELSLVGVNDRGSFCTAVARERFDCLVLDYRLGDAIATELLDDARRAGVDTPCIIISADTDQGVVVRALRRGCADFLPKSRAVLEGVLWERVEIAIRRAADLAREKRRVNRRERELIRIARTDELTGLLNRGAVAKSLEQMRARNDRRRELGFVFIDIDNFKRVNDSLGHAAGDRVLKEVAAVIREHASAVDLVARWGGEEFVVVQRSKSLIETWVWADELRRKIRGAVIASEPHGAVTVSIGIDVMPAGDAYEESVRRADHAMYLAKELGKDRVCTWEMKRCHDAALEVQMQRGLGVRERLDLLMNRLRPGLGEMQREHTGSHCDFVARLVTEVGRQLHYGEEELEELRLAGEYHDLGKVGVPEALLALPRELTDGEKRFVGEHSRFGADLMRACQVSERIVHAVEHHHDSCGGVGCMVEGKDSGPTFAAVLSACDAMATIMSTRPYMDARHRGVAMDELRKGSGGQFDPRVVEVLHHLDPEMYVGAGVDAARGTA